MNILRNDQYFRYGDEDFRVRTRRPGLAFQDFDREDYAFGPLSRFDHVHLAEDYLIKMHLHHNDEILSYIYKGEMLHRDTEDNKVLLTPDRLMVMNAGHEFHHEESTPDEGNEMLQILIRPEEEDLQPDVQFWDREIKSDSKWNLIAGPRSMDPPMVVRNEVAVFDLHGKAGDEIRIPTEAPMTPWLYVMDGRIEVSGESLDKGDGITGSPDELTTVKLNEDTTLVLFLVNLDAPMTLKGNFSGHKRNSMKRYQQ